LIAGTLFFVKYAMPVSFRSELAEFDYNHALRQVDNLFNKVILCVERLATMFVQVYAYPFIGKRIVNI